MNIYKLNMKFAKIYEQLEEADGELTPEIENELHILEGELNEKGEHMCKLIQLLKNEIEALKTETDRLSKIKKSSEKTIDRLKESLLYATETYGCQGSSNNHKLQLGSYKLHTSNRLSMDIDDVVVEKICADLINVEKEHSEKLYNDLVESLKSDSVIGYCKESLDFKDFANGITITLSIESTLLDFINNDCYKNIGCDKSLQHELSRKIDVKPKKAYFINFTNKYIPGMCNKIKTSLIIK